MYSLENPRASSSISGLFWHNYNVSIMKSKGNYSDSCSSWKDFIVSKGYHEPSACSAAFVLDFEMQHVLILSRKFM
jgi:hypothetical protein